MAGFLLCSFFDRVTLRRSGPRASVEFHFDPLQRLRGCQPAKLSAVISVLVHFVERHRPASPSR